MKKNNAKKAQAAMIKKRKDRIAAGLPAEDGRTSFEATGFGDLQPGWSIPAEEFMRRAGFGIAAMRAARARGLKVGKIGKQRFVLHEDWVEFLRRSTDEERNPLPKEWRL